MVSFVGAGRMGNFLYECATALAYALKHDLDFTVPFNCTDQYWSPIYLKHLQNPLWNPNRETIHVWENGHQYQPLEFNEEWRGKNIMIEGYRQSYKYFDQYRKEILSLFEFPWEMKKGIVSIHVRRGDYIRLPEKHPPFSEEYMRCATSRFYIKGYDHFKVFSDDIPWCREYFKDPHYSGTTIEFSTNTNEVDDLIEASCCEHHICSSSTFSIWIHWLNRNPDKIAYFPQKWFTDGWMGMNTDDIVPPECIKI